MRSLRVVVRTASGTLPLVVAASVSSAVGCGNSGGDDDTQANTMGGAGASQGGASNGGTSTGGAVSGGTAGVIQIPTGGSSTGGTGFDCTTDGTCSTITIELPPAGVPVDQVCTATVEPVESNRTASVRLEATDGNIREVAGFVDVDPQVTVVGTPTIEVLDATSSSLMSFQATEIAPAASGGFTFQGSFAQPINVTPAAGYDRMTLRVTLEADCESGSRQVHAVTDVHLCLVDNEPAWTSSGQSCCVCRIIAEMAPSPIVPEKHADDLPLAQALRLRIVELARVSNTIVLLAENDGGEGLEYEWLPSAGRIERLADDVIAWTLEEGTLDPFVQAAVYGKNSAAVASFAFNDRAA